MKGKLQKIHDIISKTTRKSETMKKEANILVRPAEMKDANTVFSFIKKLAIYEQMEDQVQATLEDIKKSIFLQKDAQVLLIEENQIPVGFALYFKTYSTFLGKANYYLEDLYIDEDKRGNGYGKLLLSHLANMAVLNKADRLEWVCLNWNKPSIAFYQSLGAKPLEDWTTFRLAHQDLKRLAKQKS